jgi:Mg/Co/Ni transporter MgtE
MIVTIIQMRQWGLEKFIIWKVDNRSERMGVIHDDDVINVNRKTASAKISRAKMLVRFSRYRAAWKVARRRVGLVSGANTLW